jgi:hypothetical protein
MFAGGAGGSAPLPGVWGCSPQTILAAASHAEGGATWAALLIADR